MRVGNKHFMTIWLSEDKKKVEAIDQRLIPHKFIIEKFDRVTAVATAINDMHVRGAGLIGAAAGYGVYLAALENPDYRHLQDAGKMLIGTRPTAINLKKAVDRQLEAVKNSKSAGEIVRITMETAGKIADEDAECCRLIGQQGLGLLEDISRKKDTVNVLTHCNAGWLAFVDYGSALATVYAAFDKGINVHVWVGETRPQNQGSRLTAWELQQHGINYTIVTDSSSGLLMQKGLVDIVIVGSDRTTYNGFVANKIGTYMKALAAKEHGIPFYVALPSSSIDWEIGDIEGIPIEERGQDEVKYTRGMHGNEISSVLVAPRESKALNYAFDVTPPKFVTGIITEKGICKADEKSIAKLHGNGRRNKV